MLYFQPRHVPAETKEAKDELSSDSVNNTNAKSPASAARIEYVPLLTLQETKFIDGRLILFGLRDTKFDAQAK